MNDSELLPRVRVLDKSKGRLADWHIRCDEHELVAKGLRSKTQAMKDALAHAENEHHRKARVQYPA